MRTRQEPILLRRRLRPGQDAGDGKVRGAAGTLLRGRRLRVLVAALILLTGLDHREAGSYAGAVAEQPVAVWLRGVVPARGLRTGHHVHLDVSHRGTHRCVTQKSDGSVRMGARTQSRHGSRNFQTF